MRRGAGGELVIKKKAIKLFIFSYSDYSLSFSGREMEEDPFFTDSEFSGSERLLSMSREDRKSSARPQIAETVNR